MSEFHAFQHRTNRSHYCNPLELWTPKIKKNAWTFSQRLDVRLKPIELAAFKQVVIKSRTSGFSYHSIAKAFGISSRTVFNLVKKIHAISIRLIHVNIIGVAEAYYSQLHAYRVGWISCFDIEKILNGETIH
jgi:hypothetical protein|tara:strand:- start:47 stop:442 length:396 start_codon:yes stop_codon:yes gene_type:complete